MIALVAVQIFAQASLAVIAALALDHLTDWGDWQDKWLKPTFRHLAGPDLIRVETMTRRPL